MGTPSPGPQYSPNVMYNPGYAPSGPPPPPYQEGIQLDQVQDFSSNEPSGSKFHNNYLYIFVTTEIHNNVNKLTF